MEVEIKGEKLTFEIRNIWEVIYDFETLTACRLEFDLKRTIAVHIAMYGVLLRRNPGMTLTMDEFVEELNHIALAKAMTEYFVKRFETLSQGEKVEHAMSAAERTANEQAELARTEQDETGEGTANEFAATEQVATGQAEAKKKRDGERLTDTKCIRSWWAVWAWLRNIFSGS